MIIILCLLFIRVFTLAYLPKINADFLTDGSYLCEQFSTSKNHTELFQKSIVCGVHLPQYWSEIFKTTGLLHTVVVSAGHAAFLMWLGRRLNKGIHLMVFSYGWLSGWQPPYIRFLMEQFLYFLNRRYRLVELTKKQRPHFAQSLNPIAFWSHSLTTLFCLITFPNYLQDLSFFLSSLCSLILVPNSRQLRAIFVFIGLLILNWQQSAWTIAMNVCFAGLMGFVLFPVSLIAWFVPWSRDWLSPIYYWMEWSLKTFSEHITQVTAGPLPTMESLWIFYWLLWGGFYFFLRRRPFSK